MELVSGIVDSENSIKIAGLQNVYVYMLSVYIGHIYFTYGMHYAVTTSCIIYVCISVSVFTWCR